MAEGSRARKVFSVSGLKARFESQGKTESLKPPSDGSEKRRTRPVSQLIEHRVGEFLSTGSSEQTLQQQKTPAKSPNGKSSAGGPFVPTRTSVSKPNLPKKPALPKGQKPQLPSKDGLKKPITSSLASPRPSSKSSSPATSPGGKKPSLPKKPVGLAKKVTKHRRSGSAVSARTSPRVEDVRERPRSQSMDDADDGSANSSNTAEATNSKVVKSSPLSSPATIRKATSPKVPRKPFSLTAKGQSEVNESNTSQPRPIPSPRSPRKATGAVAPVPSPRPVRKATTIQPPKDPRDAENTGNSSSNVVASPIQGGTSNKTSEQKDISKTPCRSEEDQSIAEPDASKKPLEPTRAESNSVDMVAVPAVTETPKKDEESAAKQNQSLEKATKKSLEEEKEQIHSENSVKRNSEPDASEKESSQEGNCEAAVGAVEAPRAMQLEGMEGGAGESSTDAEEVSPVSPPKPAVSTPQIKLFQREASQFGKVLFEFQPEGDDELSLKVGDIIELLSTEDENWWLGKSKGVEGHFPSTYVEIVDINTLESSTDAVDEVQQPNNEELSNTLKSGKESTQPGKESTRIDRYANLVFDNNQQSSTDSEPANGALVDAAAAAAATDIVYGNVDFGNTASSVESASTATAAAPAATAATDSDNLIYGNVDFDESSNEAPKIQPELTNSHHPEDNVYGNVDFASPSSDTLTAKATQPDVPQVVKSADPPTKTAGMDATANYEEEIYEPMDISSKTNDEDPPEAIILYVGRAKFDYNGTTESELTLKKGDMVEMLNCDPDEAWWSGAIEDRDGWFPSTYVSLYSLEDSAKYLSGEDIGPKEYDESDDEEAPEKELDEKEVANASVREHVIAELLKTEQDYVADLEMMIRGYMMPMRPRVGDLFENKSISIIFSNIEQLHQLHLNFLKELRQAGSDSCGQCFIRNADSFKIYSTYCANHPRACTELERILEGDLQMESFFEGCRLLVEKDISLEGFLLKPVQRICRYPLMLKELVKYTSESHPDYQHVKGSLDVMKEMASQINEDKRQTEEIVRLQHSLEGWQGPDILQTCTQLVHEGILTKISNGRAQDRQFYLFDNLFVYCKRNLKGALQVKGKIFTDSFTVINLQDGEVKHGKTPVRHAFKINNDAKGKWYVLFSKNDEEKAKWLEAFLREREIVDNQRKAGMNVLSASSYATNGAKSSVESRREDKKQVWNGVTLRRGTRKGTMKKGSKGH